LCVSELNSDAKLLYKSKHICNLIKKTSPKNQAKNKQFNQNTPKVHLLRKLKNNKKQVSKLKAKKLANSKKLAQCKQI